MRFSRIVFAGALALNISAGLGAATAQDAFPRKVIRIVVGFPPGVPADVMTRILAPKLAEGLGQQVIVENKPGAGSSIAGDHVAKSDPDGHTLFMSSIANSVAHSANKVSYHLADDLAAVSLIADVPGVLVAHPSMPATLNEFVAAAKAKPGAFAFGSSGTGSSSHLFGELLNLNAGTRLLHVPYRGSSQTLTDLIAGRIQAFFSPASTVLEQIKSGNVRALAVMGEKRTPLLSDVPTFAEQGYQGFEAAFWFGLNVPKATPPAVVQRLNKEIVRVMALPEVREKLLSHTIEPTSSSAAAFDAFLRRDIEKWARVVSAAGIKPE